MGSDTVSKALARDFNQADVDAADALMLQYAAKLTLEPHAVSQEDVDRLLAAGFSNTAVLDICQVVAYYNYVNRLADGLGVELETGWKEEDMTLTRADFDALMESRTDEALDG